MVLASLFAVRRARGQRARVEREAATALALTRNIDALSAAVRAPPYGGFSTRSNLDALRRPRFGRRPSLIGWFLRHTGRIREALEETEALFRLDALDSMSSTSRARAHVRRPRAEAIPLFEDLVTRIPQMTFPISNLLRAHAFGQTGSRRPPARTGGHAPAARVPRHVPFVRAKRNPAHLDAWRGPSTRTLQDGRVDIARLVYAAHLGLVDDAYRATELVRLGPRGRVEDIMGPDGYRTAIMFQADMPELRNDLASRASACGLASWSSGWRRIGGPIAHPSPL